MTRSQNQNQPKQCQGLTFNECELVILRLAVDQAEEKMGRRLVNSDEVQKLIHILELFLRKHQFICYGGTAINNILPQDKQFYNKNIEVPDYDFFSPNALTTAKQLADIYAKEGFDEVEAKAGQHHGTFKVFVNFIPVADITQLDTSIYSKLKQQAILKDGIYYAPPNFLRMSMYLELSRPAGDVSRWEKVLKRLRLLNDYYPITKHCLRNGLRNDTKSLGRSLDNAELSKKSDQIYNICYDIFVKNGVVFFGSKAISLYARNVKLDKKNFPWLSAEYPDFDVLAHHPLTICQQIKEALEQANIIDGKDFKTVKHAPIGELIPLHYEIQIKTDTIAFLYEPIGCHSYNKIRIQGENVKVATIDTILSFYLAFVSTDTPYYQPYQERLLCLCQFLLNLQQKKKLNQHGLFQRFSITCYGHQPTIEEIRETKTNKFKELKNKKTSKEYEEWFLNYRPSDSNNSKSKSKNSNNNSKTIKLQPKKKTLKTLKKKTLKKTKSNKNKNSKKSKKNISLYDKIYKR